MNEGELLQIHADMVSSAPKLTQEEREAWEAYCKATAGGAHVADFWWELPKRVQEIFLERSRRDR